MPNDEQQRGSDWTQPHQRPDPPPTPAPLVQRDAKGHLLPGAKLSTGVQSDAVRARQNLHRQFLAAITPERFLRVLDRHLALIEQASPRDAAKLLELLYVNCLGKPVDTVQMDVSTTTTSPATTPALRLDAESIAALQTLRSKIQAQQDEGT